MKVGPLIDPAALDKVERHVADAIDRGAELLLGGARHELGQTFFQPTVITGVSAGMAMSCEETFGPVAGIARFSTEEEAIRIANDTPYGLSAYFYSRDVGRVWRVSEGLEYGIVGINTGFVSTEVAPFGGVKESGMGREGSKYGIDDWLELKYLALAGIWQRRALPSRPRALSGMDGRPAGRRRHAAAQPQHGVGLLDYRRVVGRAYDRAARLVGEAGEQLADGAGVCLVEPGGRLVGEHDRRPRGHRPRDRDSLALSGREAIGAVVEPISEPDLVESPRRPRAGSVGRTANEQGELDVLLRGQVGDEPRLLGDEGDVLAAHPGDRRAAHASELVSLDDHRALGGPVEPGEEMQEGRLAAARPPDDGGERAALERPGESVEHRVGRSREALDHAPELGDHLGVAYGTSVENGRLGKHGALVCAREHDFAVALHGPEQVRRADRVQQRVRQPDPAGRGHDQRGRRARPAFLDHAPVAHVDEPVGDVGGGLVVADDERGRSPFADEVGDQLVDGLRACGVELSRGLVRQQKPGTMRERRAERDALLLSAGERRRPIVEPVSEPDLVEQGGRGRAGLRPGSAEQVEAEGDGVDAGEVGRQRACVVLVEQAEVLGPVARRRAGAEARHVDPEDTHRTG